MTDATDGGGLKRCRKLDKLFVLIYFYWLYKTGSCSTLHFLCCYANYLTRKQKVLCIMCISILEAKFVRKKCALYTGKYSIYCLHYNPWLNLTHFQTTGPWMVTTVHADLIIPWKTYIREINTRIPRPLCIHVACAIIGWYAIILARLQLSTLLNNTSLRITSIKLS